MQPLQEILNANVEEKLQAIETIWDSIDNNSLPVTDEETQIAKQRYEEYLQNPDDALQWKEARQKLRLKYGF